MKRLFWLLLITAGLHGESVMAIEQPHYEVIEKLGNVEIRHYEAMNVARVRVSAKFEDAGNQAFRKLAGYIFGDNARSQKIAMTAPVSQYKADKDSNEYWVTFMMPAQYKLDDLPKPQDDSIDLRHLPAGTMAAIRYKGGWSRKRYEQNRAELESTIKGSEWHTTGEPIWARYNSPMMPSWFRTNEVLQPVAK